MSLALRALGALCPTAFGLEFRVLGRFHRRARDPSRPVRCGNGFYMTGETNNAHYIAGTSERAYLRALASLMRPGELVYNLGANTGYLALWLAQHFRGELEVVGFEPDPRTAGWMARNAALNLKLPVRVESIGLGAARSTAMLYSKGCGDGAASLLPRQGVPGVQVSIERLDDYQAGRRRAPHWLVLDVEGFGAETMEGARETLRAHRPNVAAEIHSEAEAVGIAAALEPLGYRLRRELSDLWGVHRIWTARPQSGVWNCTVEEKSRLYIRCFRN